MSSLKADALLASQFGLASVPKIRWLYDKSRYSYPANLGNFSQAWWTVMRASTDAVPGLGLCGVRYVARDLQRHRSPGVFVYDFEHPTQFKTIIPGTGPGSSIVPHATEIMYVFADRLNLTIGQETELAYKMSAYWSTFAVHGEPSPPGLKAWPVYGQSNNTMLFRVESEVGIATASGPRQAACDYWDSRVP